MKVIAEYLWMDGIDPIERPDKLTADVRGKTKIFEVEDGTTIAGLQKSGAIPIWGFDGSSTLQAKGHDSDRVLKPVRVYKDPFRAQERPDYLSVLVLNEVFFPPGEEPHPSNTRVRLREISERLQKEEFWFGIEQEYTFMRADDGRPLGFPREGEPEKQGKYYCGVGADRIMGRELTNKHIFACLDVGLVLAGINSEVMPGQWEYQIGNGTPASDPLRVADDLIIARYLMLRIGEKHGIIPSLAPKPEKGDWNGAGAHTNFSTNAMRKSDGCFDEIIERLRKNHEKHIEIYGPGIQERLTGAHETCSYGKFMAGVSHRGASIRIPWQVSADGKGYMEDRRPCANMDPYVVLAAIMETVAEK